MNQVRQLQAHLQKRKKALLLPVLIVPFLTLAFWALGGGKGNSQATTAASSQDLNPVLPDAGEKEEKLMDKLGFYNKADKDSVRLAEWMRSDPYYTRSEDRKRDTSGTVEQLAVAAASNYNQRLNLSPYEKEGQKPEDAVLQKLARLQEQLDDKGTPSTPLDDAAPIKPSAPELRGDVDRLESMMGRMNGERNEDPEIKQLSHVMDKILDVQHPDRVNQRMKEMETAPRPRVLPVSSTPKDDIVPDGFFEVERESDSMQSNAIEAVVHENQVLVTGAVIKLRLLQDIYSAGSKIPAGNFVFGVVALSGERLQIEVNSIRYGRSLYPVKMEVYDMDGLGGIYIPDAISRDVGKQAADKGLGMMELTTLDPSLKAQAAVAGIDAAKSLLRRKIKLTKVLVKAGYRILLKDHSMQQ